MHLKDGLKGEKTIEMLRFLLQSIDILQVTHNESDYSLLIMNVNGQLIDARKQLRNTTTRRIRKKAAGLLFVTLLLCVQGGTFLIL